MERKTKRASRTKRTSKADRITATVLQTVAHESTAEILRKRDVLTFEGVVVEQEITALQAKLADARSRRARIEAMLTGLGMTVARR